MAEAIRELPGSPVRYCSSATDWAGRGRWCPLTAAPPVRACETVICAGLGSLVVDMAETVTIPREEYKLLLECKRIVDSDREPSEELIRAVRRSERAYREGRYKVARNRAETRKIFESL